MAPSREGVGRPRAHAVTVSREIAKLAALTLMRQGELRELRREQVHLEQGVVLLPKAKAAVRPVVLSGAAQKILRGQLEAIRANG